MILTAIVAADVEKATEMKKWKQMVKAVAATVLALESQFGSGC